MEALSVRDYRNNLSASFDRADKGEQIFIRRRNRIYVLESVGREDSVITPELQAKIDKAREEYRRGLCTSCRTKEELEAFFDSLW